MTQMVFVEKLTPRQLQVLQLMAQGKSNAEIAKALTISVATAQNHVHEILSKLQAVNRTQAVVYAVHFGLIDVTVNDAVHAPPAFLADN